MKFKLIENAFKEEEYSKPNKNEDLPFIVVRLRTSSWMGSNFDLNYKKTITPLFSKSNPNMIDYFHEDVDNIGAEELFLSLDCLNDRPDGYYAIYAKSEKYWTDCGYEYDAYYEIEPYEE